MADKRNLFEPYQEEYKKRVSEAARKNLPPNLLQSVDLQGDTLKVPTPPEFRPSPLVVGRPEMAREVYDLLRKVPNLRGLAPSVIAGPNKDTFDITQQDNARAPKTSQRDPINFYKESNLLGTTNMLDKNITINPRLNQQSKNYGTSQDDYPVDRRNTIAHEFAHSAGLGEDEAYELGDIYTRNEEEKKLLRYSNLLKPLKNGREVLSP